MRIPQEIRCGVQTIRVEVAQLADQGLFGCYNQYPTPVIQVSQDLPVRDQLQTLFHELLHHVDDSYGLALGEKKIRSLEQVIMSLIQDNPGLWDQLVQAFGRRSAEDPPTRALGGV